jgi:hypothetical protein
MAENAVESVCSQLIRVKCKIVGGMRLAKPAHVVFDEDLDALAVNASPTLEGHPDPAGGGHVGAKIHWIEGYRNNFAESIIAHIDWVQRGGVKMKSDLVKFTQI